MRTIRSMTVKIPVGIKMLLKPHTLQESFEVLQREMVEAAMKLGLGHPKVLELSQKLDQLHNRLNRLMRRTQNNRKRVKSHNAVNSDRL